MYLEDLLLVAQTFRIVMVSWLINLYHYELTFLSLMIFAVKSIMPDINLETPAYIFFLFICSISMIHVVYIFLFPTYLCFYT